MNDSARLAHVRPAAGRFREILSISRTSAQRNGLQFPIEEFDFAFSLADSPGGAAAMPHEQLDSDSDASASLDQLDRRQSERRSCELEPGEVSIRFGPGLRLPGEVLDESLTSIGIRMTDDVEVQIGQEVEA